MRATLAAVGHGLYLFVLVLAGVSWGQDAAGDDDLRRVLADELDSGELRALLRERCPRDSAPAQWDAEQGRFCMRVAEKLAVLLAGETGTSEERLDVLAIYAEGAFACGMVDWATRPLLQRARLLRSEGRAADVYGFLESARSRYPRDHDHHVYVLQELFSTAHGAGEWARAGAYLSQVDELLARTGRETGKLYFENQVQHAKLALAMGLTERADRILKETIPALERLHDESAQVVGSLINAYSAYMDLLLAQDRYPTLLREVERILDERHEFFEQRPSGRSTLLFNAGIACEMLAYTDPARWVEARAYFEAVLGEPATAALERWRSQLGLLWLVFEESDGREVLPSSESIDELRLELDRFSEWSAIHRANLEALAARRARVGGAEPIELQVRRAALEDAIEALMRQIQAEPPRAGGYGFMVFRVYRRVFAELVRLRLAMDGGQAGDPDEAAAESALQLLIDSQRFGSLARRLKVAPASLEELRSELLDARTGLLVYLPVEDGTHVFALDDARIVHAQSLGLRQLEQQVRELRVALYQPPHRVAEEDRARRTGQIDERLESLARALLPAPVQELVAGWDTVLIQGRDLLDELPFECLPLQEGRALGLAKALGYAPSLPVMLHWARARAEGSGYDFDLRLVGAAVHGERARELHGGLVEIRLDAADKRRLAAGLDGERVDLRLGRRATRMALGNAAGARARVLEILGHGIDDPNRERRRGILLSPEQGHSGLLYSADLTGLEVPPLVVLAACSSEAGPPRQGDAEAATLGGAFFAAGASGLIATSGDLTLEPVIRLMGAFAEELGGGVSPLEALRRARVRLVEQGYDDPHDFGLVHATGWLCEPVFRGRAEPKFASDRSLWPWAVTLLLLAAGAWGARRGLAARSVAQATDRAG